jgi:hypothetical protein
MYAYAKMGKFVLEYNFISTRKGNGQITAINEKYGQWNLEHTHITYHATRATYPYSFIYHRHHVVLVTHSLAKWTVKEKWSSLHFSTLVKLCLTIFEKYNCRDVK